MLAIVGPSGCGKSSLLNAAVAPLLSSDPAWLTTPSLLPGTDPLPELARLFKLTSLTELSRVAVRVFVDRRLLVRGRDDDGQVWLAAVAHEALLTGWRPLDTATADIIAALRAARAVEQAAAEWNSADRPEHFLWDAERLTATLATVGMTGVSGSRDPGALPLVEFDDEARAFLIATAQRMNAVTERERRRRTAQAQRDTAIVNQITAQADRLRSSDASLAAQLDLTA